METLEIRPITVANLPDLVSPCMKGGTIGSGLTLDAQIADGMTRSKLSFFYDRMRQGGAAVAAYRGVRPVGLLEYYPIEVAPSPIVGTDLFVINCLEVPEREQREEVEKELVAACVKDWSTRKGVVVLGRAKSWDTLGFEEVSRDAWPEGGELILWLMKFWEVEEPKLSAVDREVHLVPGRVLVDIYESFRCPWDHYVASLVEEVAEELGPSVILEKLDCTTREQVLRYGITSGIALNGEFQRWLRPHPVPSAAQVKETIEHLL
ncbi:MAG: hypothetical protein ACYTDY_13220 [Planctomycetota bacterium]|jgi:hypothetical protein